MLQANIAAFLKELAESKLVDEARLREIRQLASTSEAARTLARELVRRQWLTPFQANQLLQGQAKGLVVGPYRLLERLGEGGMGQVYKAQHQATGRIVALKVIRQDQVASADLVKRFHREVQAAAQLAHPHVVAALDAGQADDIHYFAMEYVEGTDLARLVKESGPVPVGLACELARQVALGLQAIHDHGLVHRDIKPANLLLSSDADRVVKILDLGLARMQEGQRSGPHTKLTKLGDVVGTPEYLAPEQTINSSAVDIRADLYSLGCTLFYLLAGRPPFRGESMLDLCLKQNSESLRPVRRENGAGTGGAPTREIHGCRPRLHRGRRSGPGPGEQQAGPVPAAPGGRLACTAGRQSGRSRGGVRSCSQGASLGPGSQYLALLLPVTQMETP